MLNKAVVAVFLIEAVSESLRKQQSTNEVPHSALTIAELRFKSRLSIPSKSMEEDLAVGGFDQIRWGQLSILGCQAHVPCISCTLMAD